MATATRTIRAPEATWALLDAEAAKRGESANATAADILGVFLAPITGEPITVELPEPVRRRIAAAAKVAGLPFDVMASALVAARLVRDEAEEERAPRARAAAKPKPSAAAPVRQAVAQLGAKDTARDLSPRIGQADTRGDGRGGGIVSGLSLPIGNTRAPLQKGAGKAKR